MMTEKKIPIGDYYFAREDGEIISKRGGGYRILKTHLNKTTGYRVLKLVHSPSTHKTHSVHTLMCLAFIGEPQGLQVRHKDGDKKNNAESNLHYGTVLENHRDKIEHGTSGKGEKNSMAKLTQEDVDNIRSTYRKGKRGYGYISISKKYNVESSTIQKIINREIWND